MMSELKEVCDQCGDCCFDYVEVSDEDIQNIADALNISFEEAKSTYTIDGKTKLDVDKSCLLLDEDRKCIVNDNKPKGCETYFCNTLMRDNAEGN